MLHEVIIQEWSVGMERKLVFTSINNNNKVTVQFVCLFDEIPLEYEYVCQWWKIPLEYEYVCQWLKVICENLSAVFFEVI